MGTLGYIKDSATSMYVRARYLLNNLGRWLTKDPLWPSESGFVYAGAAPTIWSDMSGLQPYNSYADCIKHSRELLLSEKQACIRCQKAVRGKTDEQAGRICGHLRGRIGPRPSGLPESDRGHQYQDPPPIVNTFIQFCEYLMPPGADFFSSIVGTGRDFFCTNLIKEIERINQKYCEEPYPGRADYPNVSDQQWQNFCDWQEFALNRWKVFCQ